MPVELTESAKRKLSAAKAFKAQEKRDRAALSGSKKSSGGLASRAKRGVAARNERNQSALNAAKAAFRRASGAGRGSRGRQSTDSNQ